MSARKQFRRLLEGEGLIVAPGAYDAFSAILIDNAGFPAVYFGSMAASATLLGTPDIGFLSCSEYVSLVSRIVDRVDIPVIADAEDGYGDLLQVRKTVQDYERAGVAAMHIEDHLYGKHIDMEHGACIEKQDMVKKIMAACDARRDPDTVIIARTDSFWAYGDLDHSLERACAYAEAGADILFIAALPDEFIEKAVDTVPGPILKTSASHQYSHGELEDIGLRVLLYFVEPMLAAYSSVTDFLSRLSEGRSPSDLLDADLAYQDIDRALRLDEYREFFRRYAGVE